MARRAEPQSFEDRNFFPSFHECPDEHEWDDRYYQDADPGNSDSAGHYRKHWCLLGEIIHTENFIRPRIVAKDNKGEEFVVAFYPDNPDDMPRILKNFKVGNTIAIMYALTHMFLDMTTGVRVEDTDDVLIIPLNMKDVIAMNKEVIKYTPTGGSPQKCHAFDQTKEAGLNKCAGCTLFFYCDKECQTRAWKEKDHKKVCKALRDSNLRWILFLDYAHHDGGISFK